MLPGYALVHLRRLRDNTGEGSVHHKVGWQQTWDLHLIPHPKFVDFAHGLSGDLCSALEDYIPHIFEARLRELGCSAAATNFSNKCSL
jgi:hypothetical protein